MDSRKIEFIGMEPVSGENVAFKEAVKAEVKAQLAQFAAALEQALYRFGGVDTKALVNELQKWAEPVEHQCACCEQSFTGPYRYANTPHDCVVVCLDCKKVYDHACGRIATATGTWVGVGGKAWAVARAERLEPYWAEQGSYLPQPPTCGRCHKPFVSDFQRYALPGSLSVICAACYERPVSAEEPVAKAAKPGASRLVPGYRQLSFPAKPCTICGVLTCTRIDGVVRCNQECVPKVLAYCSTCHGSGYDHCRMLPCPDCAAPNPSQAVLEPAPEWAQATDYPSAPLSVCCKKPTFEADGRRVCSQCRCTRPL